MKAPIAESVSYPKRWNEIHYSAPVRVPAIPAPTSLSITKSGNSAVLTWNESTGLGNVAVLRSSDGVNFLPLATVLPGVREYADAGLSIGSHFYYQVVSKVGSLSSAPSNTANHIMTGAAISSVTVNPTTQRLTIVGDGFGTMLGDVISYSRGDEATSGAINGHAATVGPSMSSFIIGIGADTAGDYLYYSAADARPGRAAAMVRRHANTGGVARNGGFGPSGLTMPKVFFSFYRKATFPGGWVAPQDYNMKLYYMFGNGVTTEGDENLPQPILHVPANGSSMYMGANFTGSDDNIGNSQGWSGSNTLDTWQRWDTWVDLNSAAGVQDGVAKVWKDGHLGINDESFSWFGTNRTYATVPTHIKQILLGYMDTGMTDFKAAHDSVYVASTMARVEIGNASTWSACTKFQIQVVTQANWENGQINDALYDLGEIPEDLAYVYLVGNDGLPLISSGYKLSQTSSLVFSNDFSVNTAGIVDAITDQHRFVRVTNNAPTGKTHSIRFNLKNGITDPITLQPGSNIYTADFSPRAALPTFNPNDYGAMTWVMWFRFDDCAWGGETDPKCINGKLAYIGHHDAETQQGFYLSSTHMGGETGNLNIGDNWQTVDSPWDGWELTDYGFKDPNGVPQWVAYAETGQPWGADGKWHELRIQFDFLNGAVGHTRARVLIDRYPTKATGLNFDSNGWFKLPPEFRPDRIRLGYGDATSANASTDRTGYAAGVQWGKEMQVWSGIVEGEGAIVSQPTLVPLHATQWWVGDSQVTGAATGLCKNNRDAVAALWPSFYNTTIAATSVAQGGRGLMDNTKANTNDFGHYHDIRSKWGTSVTTRPGPEWLHLVETGDQDLTGQRTATEYGDSIELFFRWVHSKSPNCLMSTETPFSFGREGEIWRDWEPYNTELKMRINRMAAEGIIVHLIEVNERVKALSNILGATTVWYPPSALEKYHFTAVGNLLTAVSTYYDLGHDINQINFALILAEGIINQTQIDAILQVVPLF